MVILQGLLEFGGIFDPKEQERFCNLEIMRRIGYPSVRWRKQCILDQTFENRIYTSPCTLAGSGTSSGTPKLRVCVANNDRFRWSCSGCTCCAGLRIGMIDLFLRFFSVDGISAMVRRLQLFTVIGLLFHRMDLYITITLKRYDILES